MGRPFLCFMSSFDRLPTSDDDPRSFALLPFENRWDIVYVIANFATHAHGHISFYSLQKLQMPRNPIYHPLRRRPNAQNSITPTRNLCPSCIGNYLRHDPQAHRLRLQHFQIRFGLYLECHFRLPLPFPASQDRGVWVVTQEGFVAC
jgi:hypothetical protein